MMEMEKKTTLNHLTRAEREVRDAQRNLDYAIRRNATQQDVENLKSKCAYRRYVLDLVRRDKR